MLAAQKNPKVGRAVAILKRLSADERARMIAEDHEKARRDQAACLKGALMTGRAAGRAEGLQEGEERGLQKGMERGLKAGEEKGLASVRALFEAGVPVDEIKRRLGL